MMKDLLMGDVMLVSGLVAFAIPLVFFMICTLFPEKKTRIAWTFCIAYIIVILIETVLFRERGNNSEYSLVPFVSYREIAHADIRWQIYMNIFLFVPFGFIIYFGINNNAKRTIILSFLLSASIEIIQYVQHIGLCETDDVIHNLLGTIIGLVYAFILNQYYCRVTGVCCCKNEAPEINSPEPR